MNADQRGLMHSDLTEQVIGVFYEVYNELGHGFLESVYERAMTIALERAGLSIQSQIPIDVHFRGEVVGQFRADVLVNGVLLLEMKSARALEPAHESQLLNYLRGTRCEVGLLFNFGPKPEFKRLAFSNDRKKTIA